MLQPTLTAKDYASDQEVRWCPGCGDYAILKAVQKTLADLNAPLDRTVFVSGIGCAARFPYYMACYGFHTIHGRAAAVATGVKLAQPDLDVWVVGGDGDSLSIGGNHLLHLLRRNLDLQYLLFNNEIYGLTKGQYSPTSRTGLRTPSSPAGSLERPAHALSFALGCGARFIARGADVLQKELGETLKRARAFPGTGFVEILQNCIVYNDGAFADILGRGRGDDSRIHVRHGEPLLFGASGQRGLRLQPGRLALEAVAVGADGVTERDILVHDETDRMLATLLAAMEGPAFPTAFGVLYCDPDSVSFDRRMAGTAEAETPPAQGVDDLQALLEQGHTWVVQ